MFMSVPYSVSFNGDDAISFETENVLVRRFQKEDWMDLKGIAVSNANSPFADCDESWPTEDDAVQEMTEFFANGGQFWAIEAIAVSKVVCFVNFNSIDENKTLDIGHVMNSEYLNRDYEYEGLNVLYDFAFKHYGIERIQANWALNDVDKLAPLKKLGMEVIRTFKNPKFVEKADGTKDEFDACTLVIEKTDWRCSE